ncbi:MAG: glycosyltransferase family 4 protein [Candidatus Moraniibacteriota bacterium]|nr:MAG: glycosyltransferase family 4 protein [Candidatus Moranbacteria bacterium]
MKIGIDARCFTGGRCTGVEEYARNVITRLVESSPEHTFVLFFNAFFQNIPDFSWVEKYKNVTICRKKIPNKILNFCLWYFRRPYLDIFMGGVDIFFAPNLGFISVSPKCRFVLTVHDVSFDIYPQTFSLKRRLWHIFVNPRQLFFRANNLIAVSHSTKNDIIRFYGIKEEKIDVIHSGISNNYGIMNRNDLDLLTFKDKLKLPYRFILYMGTFEPRKNIKAIVRGYTAYRRSRVKIKKDIPVQLILAGSSGWREEEMLKEIEDSPYKKDIRRIGFICEDDKKKLYNLATVFLYPSLYEGFGFPVVEAMKCGVPVITSSSSSLGEIAREGALYVDPFRPEEISLALNEILEDKVLREEIILRAKKVSMKYSWRKCAQEVKLVLTK